MITEEVDDDDDAPVSSSPGFKQSLNNTIHFGTKHTHTLACPDRIASSLSWLLLLLLIIIIIIIITVVVVVVVVIITIPCQMEPFH
jgi:hypothetical protein